MIDTNLIPGIAGIIGSKSRAWSVDRVEAMLNTLKEGGRNVIGTLFNEELGIWLGWASRDGGVCGPVFNEAYNIGLVLFGELYGDLRGSAGLQRLLRDFEKKGIRSLERLNGWFGGVLIDLREKKAYLFNDRYGLYRVYYFEGPEEFYFSSEAKTLLSAIPDLRTLDYRSLAEFFSCGCALQNRSMFSGLSLLPGGSAWSFIPRRRRTSRQSYFQKSTWEDQPPLEPFEYYRAVKTTWSGILPKYFADGRRIGLSLTGGVDSRMILAWAPCAPGELMCYTFSGPYRDCMDLGVARQVAEICGHPHETIHIGPGFLSRFPRLAEESIWVSDGTMDVTGSIDLYVQRIGRLIAPVRMTGTNGGEIMRGLVAFKPTGLNMRLFSPDFRNLIGAAERTYDSELDTNRLSFTAFKQAPWHMNTKFMIERSQISLRMPYFDNDLVALVYRAPQSLTQNNDLALRLIADGNPALSQIETDRGLRLKAVPGLTHARHLLQQFTFKLEYAYDYGMPQWLARVDHFISPLQAESYILGRHKIHHFRKWYRDELSAYVKDMLLDPRTLKRPYLRGAVVEEMVMSHTKGTANYTREIHKILSGELLHRLFIDRN